MGRPLKPTTDWVLAKKRKKLAARHNLRYHVRIGNIRKLPCEYDDCSDANTEAHHPDYDKSLEVVWLCRPHHQMLHYSLTNPLAIV